MPYKDALDSYFILHFVAENWNFTWLKYELNTNSHTDKTCGWGKWDWILAYEYHVYQTWTNRNIFVTSQFNPKILRGGVDGGFCQ